MGKIHFFCILRNWQPPFGGSASQTCAVALGRFLQLQSLADPKNAPFPFDCFLVICVLSLPPNPNVPHLPLFPCTPWGGPDDSASSLQNHLPPERHTQKHHMLFAQLLFVNASLLPSQPPPSGPIQQQQQLSVLPLY